MSTLSCDVVFKAHFFDLADYPYSHNAAAAVANGKAAAAVFAGTQTENIMFGR